MPENYQGLNEFNKFQQGIEQCKNSIVLPSSELSPIIDNDRVFRNKRHAKWAAFFDKCHHPYTYSFIQPNFYFPTWNIWVYINDESYNPTDTNSGWVGEFSFYREQYLNNLSRCVLKDESVAILITGDPKSFSREIYPDYWSLYPQYQIDILLGDLDNALCSVTWHTITEIEMLEMFLCDDRGYIIPDHRSDQSLLQYYLKLIDLDRLYWFEYKRWIEREYPPEHPRWQHNLSSYGHCFRFANGQLEISHDSSDTNIPIDFFSSINNIKADHLFTRKRKKKSDDGRLYDRIISNADPSQLLRDAIVIAADNVADYTYKQMSPEWDQHPVYIIPFPLCFIEIQANEPPYKAWGICLREIQQGDCYIVHGSLAYEKQNGDLELGIGISMELDEKRQPVSHNLYAIGDDLEHEFNYFDVKRQKWQLKEWRIQEARKLLKPIFMSLVFMAFPSHIEVEDEYPLMVDSKKHERKCGEPLVKYKTIKVKSQIKKRNHQAGQNEIEGSTNLTSIAAHLVRATYADYSQGNGLFGNPALKGIYYKSAHVRGNAENGIVIKDYEVEAPKEEKSE